MDNKNKQKIFKFKKSIKTQLFQHMKQQIRTSQLSQANNFDQQIQSKSNSRSSCFPKRKKLLQQSNNISESSNLQTKYEKLKLNDVLEKQQINKSFDYLFNEFNSDVPLLVTTGLQTKLKAYSKVVKSYVLGQISLNQIVSKKYLDWNLIISGWYWTTWTQNYRFLMIINSLISKIFWNLYRYYLLKQLQRYQCSLNNGPTFKNNSNFDNYESIELQSYEVWDIIIQGLWSKQNLNLSQLFKKQLQDNLLQYVYQKQQSYQQLFLKYQNLKEMWHGNIKPIQQVFKINFSNYHEILYNDNMEIIIQRFLLKLINQQEDTNLKSQKIRQIKLQSQLQVQLKCKKLRIITQYLSTRLILEYQIEEQSQAQSQGYKLNQIFGLLQYLQATLHNFHNLEIIPQKLLKEIIKSCRTIYQFDGADVFLTKIKQIVNEIIFLMQKREKNAQNRYCLSNYFQDIQLHTNLIKTIVSIQGSFCLYFELNYLMQEYCPIQYLNYLQTMVYFITLSQTNFQKQLVNNEDKNQLLDFQYVVLQLLEVYFKQKRYCLTNSNFNFGLLTKLKQKYGKQIKVKSKTIKNISQQIPNFTIVQYFFKILSVYIEQKVQETTLVNPQIQI